MKITQQINSPSFYYLIKSIIYGYITIYIRQYYKEKKEKMKRKKKSNMTKATTMDAIKAMRRGGREADRELFGPGFHSFDRLHKSKKTYTRKTKHRHIEE